MADRGRDNLKIAIETQDDNLCALLTGGRATGSSIPVLDNVNLRYGGTRELTGFSGTPYVGKLIEFTLEHCDTIIFSLISSWLYDKLKGRKVELTIDDDDPVAISPEAIRQALMRANKRRANKPSQPIAGKAGSG